MHTRLHSEIAFRELAHALNDVFWIYEPHCARFSYVSPAYERDWMRNAEALYADASEWLAPVHEADRSLVQASLERLAAGEEYAIEYRATFGASQHASSDERSRRPGEFSVISASAATRSRTNRSSMFR